MNAYFNKKTNNHFGNKELNHNTNSTKHTYTHINNTCIYTHKQYATKYTGTNNMHARAYTCLNI